MKLKKPTINAEQSLLEDYVDFLLTDHSNVHPLKHASLGDEKSHEAKEEIKINTEKKDRSVSESNEKKSKPFTELSSEPLKPKWASIENAVSKKKTLASNTLASAESDSSALRQKRSLGNPKEPVQKRDLRNPSPLELNHNNTRDDRTVEPQTITEESEVEQARQWDALITQEKEEEFLKESRLAKESTENEKEISDKTSRPSGVRQSKIDNKEASYQKGAMKTVKEDVPFKEGAEDDPRLANVEKLLAKISLATLPSVSTDESVPQANTDTRSESEVQVVTDIDSSIEAESTQATFLHRSVARTRDVLPEVFQTLIFHVGKLPLAVPLLKLGGIVKISKSEITPLVGSPDWFMGLLPNDRGNLMIVDTQRYIMPEQSNESADEDYQFVIVLDDSNWALACNSVGDAKNLTHDDIRWSEKTSRRPWFAGMVVDFMSALIEVDELINMLAENIVD